MSIRTRFIVSMAVVLGMVLLSGYATSCSKKSNDVIITNDHVEIGSQETRDICAKVVEGQHEDVKDDQTFCLDPKDFRELMADLGLKQPNKLRSHDDK